MSAQDEEGARIDSEIAQAGECPECLAVAVVDQTPLTRGQAQG